MSDDQPLPAWQTAVVKVGSALIAPDARGCSTRYLLPIAQWIREHRAQGKTVIVVSSGAVAAGRATQGRMDTTAPLTIPEKQAMAAIGQSLLMQHWSRLFDVPCAQVLLTYDDLRRRARFVNAKNTLSALIDTGALPIVNENDTVAVEELHVGDNDNLAAFVAVLAEADLLVMCSDVDGLYDADPHTTPDATRIPNVDRIDASVHALAGGSHHAAATGGMRTKIEAAEKATDRGIPAVIINGKKRAHLDALHNGTVPGTLFTGASPDRQLSSRKHWMRHALPTTGTLLVDSGAAKALREQGASLLPSGIVGVQGTFAQGDAVVVAQHEETDSVPIAKGITQYSAADVRAIQGKQSTALARILDTAPTDYVIHRDDLVLL
ncbi:MAG: glutamate 5-kinase [Bacteroidota bacterium]